MHMYRHVSVPGCAGWCVQGPQFAGVGGGCGIGTCYCTLSRESGGSELLAPQEHADPSLPRDLFKYSVRNNGI